MNSIHFCVSEKVFIYPLLLEALLGASNSRLTFFFSFSILKMLLVCLLAFVVTDDSLLKLLPYSTVGYVSFLTMKMKYEEIILKAAKG